MKQLMITLLLLVTTLGAQAQKQVFSKFGNAKDVSVVYISKTMLQMAPKMSGDDLNISHIASRLDYLSILESEKKYRIKEIKAYTQSCLRSGKYELVMQQRDGDESTVIYQKKHGKKTEYTLMVSEKDELTIINMMGSVTLREISNIVD